MAQKKKKKRAAKTPKPNMEEKAQLFRYWLIERVARTLWAKPSRTHGFREKWAEKLGLDPKLMQDANRFLAEDARRRGRMPSMGQKVNEANHPQITADPPEVVARVWEHVCDREQIRSSALMRSLVHTYLLGSWEPQWINRSWRWRGRIYRVPAEKYHQEHHAAWPHRKRTFISPGALQALKRRAEYKSTSQRAILRGLMLEFLEGRVKRLQIVSTQQMWNDPDRYWSPPTGNAAVCPKCGADAKYLGETELVCSRCPYRSEETDTMEGGREISTSEAREAGTDAGEKGGSEEG